MDFDLDPSLDTFRAEVRAYLRAAKKETGSHWPDGEISRADFAGPAQNLNARGWLAPHWPAEWGGSHLTPVERYILQEEIVVTQFGPIDRTALELAGPVIATFGTTEQKRRYLPKMLRGEEVWCQGFSEPESGSDVNSLRSSATRDGDHYIVEGRKIWTTQGHLASMMFGLVKLKVGEKLQHGLTFILIDMNDPNVVVTPIITIDGRHHVNEVSLNKVRVPVANVVGEVGKGWQNARFLLSKERVMVSQAPKTRQSLNRLKQWAMGAQRGHSHLAANLTFRRKLAQADIDLSALEFAVLRVLHARGNESGLDGLACVLKLRGSELRQRVNELWIEALGECGLTYQLDPNKLRAIPPGGDSNMSAPSQVVCDWLFSLSATIAGGTSEIQRNLIAGVTLGLEGA
jgi:alkylation response protein AidB-like acyl-CoA dehydrogenase